MRFFITGLIAFFITRSTLQPNNSSRKKADSIIAESFWGKFDQNIHIALLRIFPACRFSFSFSYAATDADAACNFSA